MVAVHRVDTFIHHTRWSPFNGSKLTNNSKVNEQAVSLSSVTCSATLLLKQHNMHQLHQLLAAFLLCHKHCVVDKVQICGMALRQMLHAVPRSLTIWWPRFGGVLAHCGVCGSSVQMFRLVKRKWDCGAALNCLIESVPHEPLVCQSSVGFCSVAAAHVLAP